MDTAPTVSTDTSATIGGFNPPLKVGDRFRSATAPLRWGYSVVEQVVKLGVVAAHHHPDGTRGGHINIFVHDERGLDGNGYVRL